MAKNHSFGLLRFSKQPNSNINFSNYQLTLSLLMVFSLVLTSLIPAHGKVSSPKKVEKKPLAQKASIVETAHTLGAVEIFNKNVSVVGRFNKFIVLQTSNNVTYATTVNTKLPVINAHDISRDGVFISYETNEPDYRTVIENLVTGEVKDLSSKYATDISRISPVKNEAVAITMQKDETGSTVYGLVLVNLKTGKENVLVAGNVAGPIMFSNDGSTVFYNEERKAKRSITINSAEPTEFDVTYYVPAKVSLNKGISSQARSFEIPSGFPKPTKLLSNAELSEPLKIDATDENEVLRYTFADHGKTTFRTPNLQTEIASNSGFDLRGVQIKNVKTGVVSELPMVENAMLVGLQNNGLIVWQQESERVSINFVDFNGLTSELASAVTAANFKLPIKTSTVTQVGNGYSTACKVASHINDLKFAYDFQGSYGAHVLASASGRIVKTSNTVNCSRLSTCRTAEDPYKSNCGGSDWGNYIIIRHDDGTRTLYAHLRSNSIQVCAGIGVKQGRYIGIMGHTGYMISSSCGDHLHQQKMALNDSNPGAITPSVAISYSDASSNPLTCKSYTSGLTETTNDGSFSMYASPNYVTVYRGSTATYNIYAYSYDGFRGQVQLLALYLPNNQVLPGTGFTPQTLDLTADYTYFGSTLRIVTNSYTPTGTYYITVRGQTCNKDAITQITLRVL